MWMWGSGWLPSGRLHVRPERAATRGRPSLAPSLARGGDPGEEHPVRGRSCSTRGLHARAMCQSECRSSSKNTRLTLDFRGRDALTGDARRRGFAARDTSAPRGRTGRDRSCAHRAAATRTATAHARGLGHSARPAPPSDPAPGAGVDAVAADSLSFCDTSNRAGVLASPSTPDGPCLNPHASARRDGVAADTRTGPPCGSSTIGAVTPPSRPGGLPPTNGPSE